MLGGRIALEDVPALSARAGALLRGCDAGVVVCDVAGLVDPDVATVAALARLQLTARRSGLRMRFRHACGRLEELLALTGLGDVLPCGPASGVEPGGQPEEREQALGVEEEADPDDPAA